MALCSHHGGSVYISCSDNICFGFGSHLCALLRREKITITNDKIFSAETLTELAREDAIKKSNIVIILISKEYPSSKDCLDELEMILKYGEQKEILPVFYHIRSEDIRYAFIELESKFPEQMVKIWRNGFEKVAAKAKAPYKVNIDRDESGIVQDITRDVSSMMKCEDLLTEIFKKLPAFHDFALCSTVCKLWRSRWLNLKWSLYPPHPWSIHFQGQNIMNHLDDERYTLERWEIDGRYYYGCVNGWILSIGSKHISIFNLFSSTQRNLPMLSPVGNLPITKPVDWYRYIDKFILFKVGQGDDFQFFAVALFGPRGFIAFTRPSVFQDWICIEGDDMACCRDVVLFQGRFYALCGRGKLFLCAFDRSNPCVSLVSQEPAGSFRADRYYLVKNVDHLIEVFQYGNVDSGGKRFGTGTFKIYRSDNTRYWTQISEPDYLKGRALFISNGNSWTVDPAKVESCRTNSIYFVDDYWFSNNKDGHFIGVFDIADQGMIKDFQFDLDQYPPNNSSPFSLIDKEGA